MRFLGNILSTIIGLFLFCIFFFFGIMIIVALVGNGGREKVSVDQNSVIELDLSGIRNDYGGKSYYRDFDYAEVKNDGLSDVIKALQSAATDDKIEGISILNNNTVLGPAQCKALRDELEKFKKSGKFILSYANDYSQKDYYLNSVADTIYLNPVGSLEFKGLSSEIMFFKELQEKSGITLEVVRHGRYKSAVEPFLENKMSDANREQVSSLLSSVWNSMLKDISVTRKIPVEHLNEIADGLLARTPELAIKEKLIDKIAYEDVYHNDIRKLLDVDPDKKYNKIDIADYAANVATTPESFSAEDKIAIIYGQGEILSGEGSEGYIGEGSMRRSFQQARRDKNVKAIVLRIDSPGGSALTSELIWREIELTKKVKPVVVSIGNLGASGGYYIACNANTIYAEENTITGSIGVFGLLPNFTTLANKAGIHTEQVSTNKNAAGYSAFLPLNPNFKAFTQQEVERTYNTFVSRVASGRKMSIEAVEKVAQGRIWSGSDAVKIGLIDKIGGMDDALRQAAALAKIKNYTTQDYPEYEKDLRDLLGGMGIPFVQSKEDLIREEIGEQNFKILEKVKRFSKVTGVHVMLPFEINIQ